MDYFTPVKEATVFKGTKTATQTREGDWVCLNCNNLNFSFRKKCNRCKTQTREQNEATSAYSYYYYQKQYVYLPLPQQQHAKNDHTPTSANSPHPTYILQTPNHNKENKTPPKHQKDLPSVSPLVKKYNSRDLNLSQSSKTSSAGSVWGVRDFEQAMGASGRSEECDREDQSSSSQDELERMIGRIMI